MRVPRGQKVEILQTETQESIFGRSLYPVELYIEEDVTLNISSSFQDLVGKLSGAKAKVGAIVSSSFNPARSYGASGQFSFQSFQIWESTEPIEMSFNCRLDMKMSGKTDVLEPTRKILSYAIPGEAESTGGLIPPGPSPANAVNRLIGKLKGSNDNAIVTAVTDFYEDKLSGAFNEGDGNLMIKISEYLDLSPIIITKVVPIFSNKVDEEGYPISVQLQIDIRTADIPTKLMTNEAGKISMR